MARQHLLDLARRGAEVRLRELAHEARHLLAVFPHLGDSFDPDELPMSFLIEEGARQSPDASTAAEADVVFAGRGHAARRKKYWAGRPKTKARS